MRARRVSRASAALESHHFVSGIIVEFHPVVNRAVDASPEMSELAGDQAHISFRF